MVFKDQVSTKRAQLEMAKVEKQLLKNLKNNNPNKNATSAPSYTLPFDIELAEPAPAYHQYKPQEMHCLKKLLEQDYTVETGVTNNCLLHNSPEQCKCMVDYYPEGLDEAVISYIQEEYQKYLGKKKEKEEELMAKGYDVNYSSESEPCSDSDSSSSDDDDDDDEEAEDAEADADGDGDAGADEDADEDGPPQVDINIM